MDRTSELEQAAREVCEAWLNFLKPKGQIRAELIVDENKKRFVLMTEIWYGLRRSYGPMLDVGVEGNKIWIHADNTEEGIPDELLAKGVKPHEIVLGWQPEYKRELTGFAVS